MSLLKPILHATLNHNEDIVVTTPRIEWQNPIIGGIKLIIAFSSVLPCILLNRSVFWFWQITIRYVNHPNVHIILWICDSGGEVIINTTQQRLDHYFSRVIWYPNWDAHKSGLHVKGDSFAYLYGLNILPLFCKWKVIMGSHLYRTLSRFSYPKYR